MKLWTLQSRTFLDAQHSPILLAAWGWTPQNWRVWYRWMCQQWELRLGSRMTGAPLWCWHSCNGALESEPTVGTYALLMGDWDHYASSMVSLQLDVPDNLVLLSSYSRWNEAIDDAIDRKLADIDGVRFYDMFEWPMMKHDTDDVQAVVPYIDTSWITDVRGLPYASSDQLDWDLVHSWFPGIAERTKM